jgi:HEAT repeat protein
VVLLRSAIEAFGALGTLGATGSGDDQYLIPLLSPSSAPSQDIRAAAALALGNLCDPDAIQALRTQFGQENVPQVQYAISEALRVLGSCP